jgi:UDP-GlcNAc:undecaprenyl-phosphate GlcNAc-1-phosphate transferase
LGQVAACLVTMMVSGLYIHSLDNLFGFGDILLRFWLAVPFTILAVVGVINALNLIDGLDGLASGVSVIALSAFFILAWMDGNAAVALLCAALLGAVLGFLKYNLYPARIFMGDTGSMTLGFILAFLAILLTQTPEARISPIVPMLILGLPIIDTLWVMGRRLTKRQNPFVPDQTHVHHKFLNLGLQHRFTVIFLYGVSLFWAGVSIVFCRTPAFILLAAFVLISAASYGILRYMINNRERFGFLALDSPNGIRESKLYGRIADLVDRLTPLVVGLMALLLVSAALFGSRAKEGFWQISSVIFLAGLGLIYHSRNLASDFLRAILFFGILVVAFVAQLNADQIIVGELSLRHLNNLLFMSLTVLVALRVVFRRPGELFFTTVDYLVIGMAIFFTIFLPQIDTNGNLSTALPKAIVLFLAIKLIAMQGRRAATFALGSLLATLLVISLRSFLGQF